MPVPDGQLESLRLIDDVAPRSAAQQAALGPVLLTRVARDGDGPALRIYRPPPTVAFSGRDCVSPGIGSAARAAAAVGFAPVRRGPGGRAAAYHGGCLCLDHVSPEPLGLRPISARFAEFGALIAGALHSIGMRARVGQVPGEYCPGEFSVNDGHGHKIAGTAQRLVSGGWLFSTVVVVENPDPLREVLQAVYRELGLEWDPATVGAVDTTVPGIGLDRVRDALLAAYAERYELMPAELSRDSVEIAARSESRYLIAGFASRTDPPPGADARPD